MNHPLPRGWQEKNKDKLIKDNNIKKEKTISEIYKKYGSYYERILENNNVVKDVCIDDELPFDIPDNWDWVRLGSVSEIFRGGSPRPISKYLTTSNDGINWIKISDAEKNGKYINSTKEKIIKEGVNKSRFVKSGDFLLTNSMSFGRPYILNIDGCIHDGWLVISKYKMNYNIEFLFYLLSSNFAYYQFCKNVSGSVVQNLTIDKVANSIFPLPPLDEQKRIAEVLSLCDDLIENLTKLIEKKEIYKKGVMQRVLTGKVRFNGFTDEWEEVYIKDVGTIITGNTPSTKDKSFWGGKHIWVTPTDINKKDIDNSERKLTDIGLSKARKLPKNTLLVTCIASIGKNSILRCEGSCNQQINAIIPNKNFSAEFLYYIFENNKEYLNAKAPASATKIISKTEFEKLSFIFPKIEEQNKIAELLTLIDKDIEILKQLLHLRKLQKKGLMQKLLTGEVRI